MRPVVAAVGAAAVGPLLLIAVWSVASGWYWPALLPRNWSLRAWTYIVAPAAGVQPALGGSLLIASVVALAAVALAVPAARVLALHSFRGRDAMLACLLIPAFAPPLASIMGLHRMMLTAGLTDSVPGVAFAHLPPAISYAVLVLIGSFSRLDSDLESLARTLGANSLSVWRHVTIPSIAPGLAVAFSFAFLVSWSQYLSTLLIGGGHVRTLPLELVAFQRSGDEAVAASLALVFVAPALGVIALVGRWLRH